MYPALGTQNYSCNCVQGFTDANCSTNIDDCVPSACTLPLMCYDLINDYKCACPIGLYTYPLTLCFSFFLSFHSRIVDVLCTSFIFNTPKVTTASFDFYPLVFYVLVSLLPNPNYTFIYEQYSPEQYPPNPIHWLLYCCEWSTKSPVYC